MSDLPIICVTCCHQYVYPKHDEGGGHKSGSHVLRAQAARDTWYKIAQQYRDRLEVKFFYGRWPSEATRAPLPDEVFLDCPDDYYSLPQKVQAMFQWVLENGNPKALKVDDDVAIYIPRLLPDLDSPADYRGYEIEMDIKFASGTAYWLSRLAMELVAREEIDPKEWREDHFVGQTLFKHGIKVIHDPRYHCCHCPHCQQEVPEDSRITSHTVDPKKLRALMETSNA